MSDETHEIQAPELLNVYSALRAFYDYSTAHGGTTIEAIRHEHSEVIAKAFEVAAKCKWCGDPTESLGTTECDRCLAIVQRIKNDPELAWGILDAATAPESKVPEPHVVEEVKADELAGPFYTIAEVAERLQLDPKTIRRFIDRRKLPALKFGHGWRISEVDLQGFIDRSRVVPEGQAGEAGQESKAETSETPAPEPSVRLKIGDVASRLRVATSTIYRCILDGKMQGPKIGRYRFVDRTGLIDFLDDDGYRNGGEMLPSQYIKTAEAAEILGVGSEEVTLLARSGALKSVRLRKSWRFLPSEVQRWKDEHPRMGAKL